MAFNTAVDIANRALQLCGVPPTGRITALTDATKNAKEIIACYDSVRRAELRASPWLFAIRRSPLRPLSATSQQWTPPAYASGTSYSVGSVVSYDDGAGSRLWISLQGSNLGNTPTSSPAYWESYCGPLYADTWDSATAYVTGDLVVDTGVVYLAIQGSTNVAVATTATWTAQGGTIATAVVLYPLGSGPVNVESTLNVYPLPNGWLANAPQEPRNSRFSNLLYGDWRIENRYIVTRESQLIILRFVEDMSNVPRMDPMFCEAFAARISMSICESLTQSVEKIKQIGAEYEHFIDVATGTNAIEVGSLPTGDGFQYPEDIANRALQHCGAPQISSFSENTRAAHEVRFSYNKLRQAELRARDWRFAIRRAVMRPISSTTVLWTPPTYAAGTTYDLGAIVAFDDGFAQRYWISKTGSNLGTRPGTSTAAWENYYGPLYADVWASTTTYLTGDLVVYSSIIYYAIAGSTNVTPGTDATKWVAQTGTNVAASILFPMKTGPVSELSTLNVYPLPYGWLKNTYQEPRTATAASLLYGDWRIEGQFIVTRETQPIILRFIADITDVSLMDAMFCEALAARVALSIQETFAPKPAEDQKGQAPQNSKVGTISMEYDRFISEAEQANSIEVGPLPAGEGFNFPEDIANRALQYCGAPRIASFGDNSRAAAETQFCYHKLRQAELRKNIWRFSIRHAVLRAMDSTSLLWTPPAYASGTTYSTGQVVTFDNGFANTYWISKVDSNTGNTPSRSSDQWENYFGPVIGPLHDATQTYAAGDIVYTGVGTFYLSIANNNSDTPPTANWAALNGTTATPPTLTPNAYDPAYTSSTLLNIFPLPHGWLRAAPQAPKRGSVSYLGAPGNVNYSDWLFEEDHILSNDSGPIVLRFVADIRDVTTMDSMFCEGLAARMAISVFRSVSPNVQSIGPDGKPVIKEASEAALNKIELAYKKFMSEAAMVNGIELDSVESPLDDYLSTRA